MTYTKEVSAIWEALQDIQGNVHYMKQHMPEVTLAAENRQRLAAVLGDFDGLLCDLRTETRNLEDKLGLHPGEPPNDPDIRNTDPRVTLRFLREWPKKAFWDLNEVVEAIEPAEEGLAFLLVAESTTNMLGAHSRLWDALERIDAALQAAP